MKWNVNFILNERVETIHQREDVAKSYKGKSLCNKNSFEKKPIKFSVILSPLKLSDSEVNKIKIGKL